MRAYRIHVITNRSDPSSDGNSFSHTVEVIERSVRQHSNWQSVQYKGRRYQLHGGVRTPYFINKDNPIKTRQEQAEHDRIYHGHFMPK